MSKPASPDMNAPNHTGSLLLSRRNAAALLTDVAEGEDAGPSQPDAMWPVPDGVPAELPSKR